MFSIWVIGDVINWINFMLVVFMEGMCFVVSFFGFGYFFMKLYYGFVIRFSM